jgi:hypothetical protein
MQRDVRMHREINMMQYAMHNIQAMEFFHSMHFKAIFAFLKL